LDRFAILGVLVIRTDLADVAGIDDERRLWIEVRDLLEECGIDLRMRRSTAGNRCADVDVGAVDKCKIRPGDGGEEGGDQENVSDTHESLLARRDCNRRGSMLSGLPRHFAQAVDPAARAFAADAR